jgi:hypothetical protein
MSPILIGQRRIRSRSPLPNRTSPVPAGSSHLRRHSSPLNLPHLPGLRLKSVSFVKRSNSSRNDGGTRRVLVSRRHRRIRTAAQKSLNRATRHRRAPATTKTLSASQLAGADPQPPTPQVKVVPNSGPPHGPASSYGWAMVNGERSLVLSGVQRLTARRARGAGREPSCGQGVRWRGPPEHRPEGDRGEECGFRRPRRSIGVGVPGNRVPRCR